MPNGSTLPENAHSTQAYGSEAQSSWEGLTSPDNFAPDLDLLSPSDISRFGSFDSFDSMTFLMSNTAASSVSESYACIGTGSGFDSPGAQLHDLSLPGTSTMSSSSSISMFLMLMLTLCRRILSCQAHG